jgi:hypothetical protein
MASNKLPATGTTITMGRVRNAFNLAGTAALVAAVQLAQKVVELEASLKAAGL